MPQGALANTRAGERATETDLGQLSRYAVKHPAARRDWRNESKQLPRYLGMADLERRYAQLL